MPKILWVALPLLLAAAVLALQVARRRPPSRHAVNIVSSVLLLAYVATTAGLGIFWVANQQLPVFDWHYLFGYGTVLLVSLHLVFNFPAVWRFLARRRPAARAEPPMQGAALPARRGALALIGAGAAVVAAFVLGLRHGRSDLRIEPPAAGPAPDPGATALGLVQRFHAFSSHSRRGVLARAPGVDWGDPPPAFKRMDGASRMSLPGPGAALDGGLGLAAVADLLWHTTGVSDTRGGLHLRTSPSSGALFSTELYVAVRALPGVAPGLWHYDPQGHALVRVGEAVAPAFGDAPVGIVATAIFRRTGHKYRDRTYRYVLADLGHALENLRVAALVRGVPVGFAPAFDEARVAGALGIDEAEEGVLALVGLGTTAPPAPPAPRWGSVPWPPAEGAPLGVTAAVHAATSLRAVAAPAPTAAAPVPTAGTIALPSPAPVTPDWLRVIAQRRSVRRYAGTPLRLEDVAAVLSHMVLRHAPVLSSAVRVNLVVHAVAGLQPGAYRYLPQRHALLARRTGTDLRAASRAAALDQDVIGDAAAVFVLSIDTAAFAADPNGPARGYRHAFIEAGLVGERVYLEAGARGLGACAVGAFYDDEAAALVGEDPAREWVVHFAALGIRA